MSLFIWSAYDRCCRAPHQVGRFILQSVVEVYREANAEQTEAGYTELARFQATVYIEYGRERDRTVNSQGGRTPNAIMIPSLRVATEPVSIVKRGNNLMVEKEDNVRLHRGSSILKAA